MSAEKSSEREDRLKRLLIETLHAQGELSYCSAGFRLESELREARKELAEALADESFPARDFLARQSPPVITESERTARAWLKDLDARIERYRPELNGYNAKLIAGFLKEVFPGKSDSQAWAELGGAVCMARHDADIIEDLLEQPEFEAQPFVEKYAGRRCAGLEEHAREWLHAVASTLRARWAAFEDEQKVFMASLSDEAHALGDALHALNDYEDVKDIDLSKQAGVIKRLLDDPQFDAVLFVYIAGHGYLDSEEEARRWLSKVGRLSPLA